MLTRILTVLFVVLCAVGPAAAQAPPSAPAGLSPAARDVWNTEVAFAKTMADRDHKAFSSFLSNEAVFFGQASTLRGKAAVAEGWRRFYEGPQAPFSWGPDRVEVLDSGGLALSSGPVFDPAGKRTGTFTSIWRKEADGTWRIIFDKGC